AAIEDLITACVHYHRVRAQAAGQQDRAGQPGPGDGAGAGDSAVVPAAPDGTGSTDAPGGTDGPDGGDVAVGAGGSRAQVLAMLEHQILAMVLQVVSGPGGVASFLRRNLLGKGLGGPSLPLDVGQAGQIPAHLRRLVALRDQGCQFPGGCGQPAAGCEPHHVIHRADGGRTSLANLKDYCWWHHHVVLHELGWALAVHPDGTSQARSPGGKIIRSHSPPPRPG
ncbi:MAG TPA: HNH endonuclease signature motif containing protein, partial [Streptosporangiaceae bacterium]|nr:HNH endonuclease signature motif containing protein [Streptosporangiaceae bacterium]